MADKGESEKVVAREKGESSPKARAGPTAIRIAARSKKFLYDRRYAVPTRKILYESSIECMKRTMSRVDRCGTKEKEE